MDEVMRLLLEERCLIICESEEEKLDFLEQVRDFNDFPMSDLCKDFLKGQETPAFDSFYVWRGRTIFAFNSHARYRDGTAYDVFYKDIRPTTPIDHIDIPNLCKLFDEEVASE